MKKRKFANAAVMLILLSVVGYAFFGSPVEMYRRRALRQAMAAVEDGEVTLNEIVPFAWDTMYTYEPYMSREEVEEMMQIPVRGLKQSVSEGAVQLVFVKNGHMVCNVCGYISREGYAFLWWSGRLDFEDETVFQAKRDGDGILWLTGPHD
ncbi:MAG: hypothetical protein HFE60_06895 [Anaerotignum sp.]|nr:hypothetical protein [Anaerotignum sp.]